MAHNTAWIAEHAEEFARIEAARARAARLADIAELRAGYTTFVQQFAGEADRLYIDAAFIALEYLEGEDYENAWGALDEKIDALDRAADAGRQAAANPVTIALEGWLRTVAPAIATAPRYAEIANGLFVRTGNGKKNRRAA